MLSRREFLAAPATLAAADSFRSAPYRIDADEPAAIQLDRRWSGTACTFRLRNTGQRAVRVRQVVLFDWRHGLAAETPLYGDSFQMLSQTAGTLGAPLDLAYSERKHYRLPQPEDAHALSGVMTLAPAGGQTVLLGFASCRRFAGRFFVRPDRIEVVADTENLELAPGASWELEEFVYDSGTDRNALLERFAACIARHHPRLAWKEPPAGWCSWYCFGPRVTGQNVMDNLEFIAKNLPGLRYIQIDDGYQSAMGDWLLTGSAFGGDVRGVLKQTRARGFEPAIWVAPFVAEEKSQVFSQHPDWFIRDAQGAPLRSDKVTFGGWRRGPWYAFDGTHPEVQRHLASVFRTMRQEWGCTYFKLDANFWGAMHGGRFHDPAATRIEAYRRGMQAILRGAGDAFLLGCNHPLWASLGLIHGSRSSGDISRRWPKFRGTARENLSRNWQNGRLWWNDPDCAVLSGNLSDAEFRFHATALFATGGMMLSGDDLPKLAPERLAMLRKLLPATGVAAEFADATLRVGYMRTARGRFIVLLNPSDEPVVVAVGATGSWRDLWTGLEFAARPKAFNATIPPHDAFLLEVV